MRKIFLFMMISLDGYFEGKNHDISWHTVDAEFNAFANRQLDEADTLIFGHRTYELMAGFWPTKAGLEGAPETAQRMNAMPKIVFSHRSLSPTWQPIATYTDVEVLRKIKAEPGKPLIVMGSSDLGVSLLEKDLLDEVRVMVNPVALGAGTPLFKGLTDRRPFDLAAVRRFTNGNVLLRYTVRPAG